MSSTETRSTPTRWMLRPASSGLATVVVGGVLLAPSVLVTIGVLPVEGGPGGLLWISLLSWVFGALGLVLLGGAVLQEALVASAQGVSRASLWVGSWAVASVEVPVPAASLALHSETVLVRSGNTSVRRLRFSVVGASAGGSRVTLWWAESESEAQRLLTALTQACAAFGEPVGADPDPDRRVVQSETTEGLAVRLVPSAVDSLRAVVRALIFAVPAVQVLRFGAQAADGARTVSLVLGSVLAAAAFASLRPALVSRGFVFRGRHAALVTWLRSTGFRLSTSAVGEKASVAARTTQRGSEVVVLRPDAPERVWIAVQDPGLARAVARHTDKVMSGGLRQGRCSCGAHTPSLDVSVCASCEQERRLGVRRPARWSVIVGPALQPPSLDYRTVESAPVRVWRLEWDRGQGVPLMLFGAFWAPLWGGVASIMVMDPSADRTGHPALVALLLFAIASIGVVMGLVGFANRFNSTLVTVDSERLSVASRPIRWRDRVVSRAIDRVHATDATVWAETRDGALRLLTCVTSEEASYLAAVVGDALGTDAGRGETASASDADEHLPDEIPGPPEASRQGHDRSS